MKTTLDIEGMTCASCVSKVQRALEGVQGIKSAQINLALNLATVETAEPGSPTVLEMTEAVKKIGYGAKIHEKKKHKTTEPSPSLNMDAVKTVFSFLIAAVLMILGMGIGLDPKIQLILCTPIQFWAGYPFLVGVYKGIRYRSATMDTLVGLGTLSAYFYSVFLTFAPHATHDHPHVYYEISASLVAFILLGKQLEARAKKKTSAALEKLIELTPDQVRVIRNSTEIQISLDDLQDGDTVRIRPGERLPADGKISAGQSALDESMLTGESLPVSKTVGAQVFAGTLNQMGSFDFVVEKTGDETTLSKIISLVSEAQSSKAPIQKTADQVSAVFVPVILGLAAITGITWWILTQSMSESLLSAISVLVIACPCALGLAVPTAIIVATGRAAQEGLLFRNAEALETLGQITTFVFDKTGTLTEGKPRVTQIKTLGNLTEDEALRIAAAAESGSEHPLAQSIVDSARSKNLKFTRADFTDITPGAGLRALVEGKKVFIGNEAFMRSWDQTLPSLDSSMSSASTCIWLSIDGKTEAIFLIEDSLRAEAKGVLQDLQSQGFETILLSGDRKEVVEKTALATGITRYIAEAKPEDKLKLMKDLPNAAMIGDGINDSPALSQAKVGIALARGNDIAIQSADVILMRNDLRSLLSAIQLSKLTRKTIRENLAASMIYNLIGIPIAAGALYPFFGIRLSPMIAGAAMALSSVSVVSNSLRLKKRQFTVTNP